MWSGFTVLETTDSAYDLFNHVLTQKRSGAGADVTLTQYSYDPLGRPECTAVRMNPAIYGALPGSACDLGAPGPYGGDRITRLVYDPAGQVKTEQRAYRTALEQNYATYGYTFNGLIDWVEDAKGNHSDYTYDGHDRLVQLNFPDPERAGAPNSNDFERYEYDENGNRTGLHLRSMELIQYQFDALNRMSVKQMPDPDQSVYYEYDNQGHQTAARLRSNDGYGEMTAFDGLGRLEQSTSRTSAGTLVLKHRYDLEGNRTAMIWPDGQQTLYSYDGRNRPSDIRENGQSAPLVQYTYDTPQRRMGLQRGNATTTIWQYDGLSRLSGLTQDLPATSRDLSIEFGYNSASQVIRREMSNDRYAYTAKTQSTVYVPDGLNRYASVGGVTFTYDKRGNLTSDGTRTLSYDLENRLLSVKGGATLDLSYDPMGRLQTTTSNNITTRYLDDGDRLVAEYQGAALLRRYVHGAGTDEPLVWYEGATLSDKRYLHADHQGSVIATSTAATSTAYAYGAYGEPENDNWGGSRFRYTGQIALPEAKLYHYKARVYDPYLGRFLQTDPIGYDDNWNLYAYVRNDPINGIDPTGASCAQSGNEQYQCQVDSMSVDDKVVQREDFSKEQLAQVSGFENRYTSAVNKLMSNPDRSVPVSVPGEKSFTVSAGEVGKNLIKAEVRAAPGTEGAADTSGDLIILHDGILSGASSQGNMTARQLSDFQAMGIVHEGIHWTGWGPLPDGTRSATGERSALNPYSLGRDPLKELHQRPYNDAARRLLWP
jgi:RHS repeat-associated protein